MSAYLFAFLVTILNRLRGSDHRPVIFAKPFTSIMTGALAGWYRFEHTQDAVDAIGILLIVSAGIYLWCVFGWGRKFLAIHGRVSIYLDEKPEGWEDRVADFIMGRIKKQSFPSYVRQFCTTPSPALKCWGMYAMSLRGLYMLPMFIALALYQQNPFIAFLGLGMAFQGAIYRLAGLVPEDLGRDQHGWEMANTPERQEAFLKTRREILCQELIRPIAIAEFATGALIGALLTLAI